MPQVEVTFDIDANGIVQVSAKDKATSKEQQIRIQASGGLSEADIQKMVKDAELHAEEDKKKRELIDARNQGEALVHSTDKNLKEFGDKVGPAEKSAIESALEGLKSVLTGEDAEAIKTKTNDRPGCDEARRGDVQGSAGRRTSRGSGRCGAGWRGREPGGQREGRRRRVRGRHRQEQEDGFRLIRSKGKKHGLPREREAEL
jgi:molecular chaperone DnaK